MKKNIAVFLCIAILYGCSTTNKEELNLLNVRVSKLEDLVKINAASIANNTERINSIDQRLLLIQKRLQKEREKESFISKIPPLSAIIGDNSTGSCKKSKTETGQNPSRKVIAKVQIKSPKANYIKPTNPSESPGKPDKMNSSSKVKSGGAINYKDYYKMALKAYMNFNYPKAIQMFKHFLKTYRNNDLDDNALYWLASAYLRMNKTEEAIKLYRQLLEKYPYGATSDGGKTDAALYELIKIYMQNNEMGKADRYAKILYERFPGSIYAKYARKMLSKRGNK